MEPKTTRAAVAPPKKQTFLPETAVGEEVQPADNMKKSKKAKNEVGMTFNMPRDWHTRFKMAAVSRGWDMKDLLVECFATWEKVEREKSK
jgi:hypothetical protein